MASPLELDLSLDVGQGCLVSSILICHPSPQAEERSQFEILKAQMFAERLAKRNRRAKRARAMPEEEPARGPGRHMGSPKELVGRFCLKPVLVVREKRG